MLSLLEIIKRTTDFLGKAGLETPRRDAELLIGHALDLTRTQLYLQFERPLTEAELEKIRPLARRRSKREPVQYIIGYVDFMDIRLRVDKRALVPRPETEELADLLIRRLKPVSILDLGTGSGALALALAAAFPAAEVTAVDRSLEALSLARENASANELERVRFLESDWFRALPPGEGFDLIVSNPPYLTTEEWETAEDEVRVFEPKGALVAEEEGRSDLETILQVASNYLTPGGWVALETGIAQHEALQIRAAAAGLVDWESIQDMSGRPRFFLARRP